MHAESVREGAHGQRPAGRSGCRDGQTAERRRGLGAGPAFGDHGDVRGVDEPVGGLHVAPVERAHDLPGRQVAVAAAQREEGTPGLGVLGRVAPVPGPAALGRREDADVLVVADRLGGQPVFPGQVDGSHCLPPTLLALGEPTHGIAAFPLLRNDLLRHLVDRGYRSIVLETDVFAASVVDAYVGGAETEIETVLATGFSHGFGAVPGNRELVVWLREHNAGCAPQDRVHFHGFDAPVELSGAPSPRRALFSVIGHRPTRSGRIRRPT